MDRRALAHAALATVLVAAAVVACNQDHVFAPDLVGDGDISANGLLIRDAADLALGHGPYSRLGFHHPGPVTFYGLAALAPAMPGIASPLGRERAAMLALNALFLLAALLLAARLGDGPLDAWLVAACLCLVILPIATTAQHPLLDYWGPLVVILPAFVLAAAAGPLLQGERAPFPVFCAAAVVMVHNHAANLAVVGPLALAVAAAALVRRRGGRPAAGRQDRRGRLALAAGVLLLVVTSVPIVAEELAHDDGNLTRLLQWLGEQPRQERSLADVVRASGWAATAALTLGVPGLAGAVGLVPAWLAGLLAAGAAAAGLAAWRRAGAPLRAATAAAGAGWLLLVAVAWRMPENPATVPYVFHESAAFAAFFLWLAVRRPAGRWAAAGGRVRKLAAGVLAAAVAVGWVARFPVGPTVPIAAPAAVWAALPPPAQGPVNAYLEHGGPDHELWPRLVALTLAAEQRGYRVRVPAAWSFLQGRRRAGPALPDAPTVVLSGRDDLGACLGPALGRDETASPYRVLGPGWTFARLEAVLASCTLPGLEPGAAYGAGADAWAWSGWHGPESAPDGAYRWSLGDSCRIAFAAAPALADLPDPRLELRLGALGRQQVDLALNGRPLGRVTIEGFAARPVRLPVPAGLLRAGPGNSLAIAVPGAASPGGGDARRLGVRLVGLRFAGGEAGGGAP